MVGFFVFSCRLQPPPSRVCGVAVASYFRHLSLSANPVPFPFLILQNSGRSHCLVLYMTKKKINK